LDFSYNDFIKNFYLKFPDYDFLIRLKALSYLFIDYLEMFVIYFLDRTLVI